VSVLWSRRGPKSIKNASVSVGLCGESLAGAQSWFEEVGAWLCCEKERDGEVGACSIYGQGSRGRENYT
jgi:hypothetical protein